MSTSWFECEAAVERPGRPERATVWVDRERGLMGVRGYGRRRAYVLPLSAVAEMIAHRVERANAEAEWRRRGRRGNGSRGVQRRGVPGAV